MNNQYLLSLIIPHYNSPDLLDRLLDSLPKRKDFQIIIVDDNSTKKLDILEACKQKHQSDNVLFLRNKTGRNSAGTCRNIGLEHALGQWLLFADSDDVFLPQTESILKSYLSSDYDIVFFTPTSIDFSTGESTNRHKDFAKLVHNYLENPSRETELRLRYFHVCPWTKLIRKEIVDTYSIRFDSTMVSNDVMFSTVCGHYAKKIHATKEQIYCVTATAGSLTTRSSEKNFDIRTNVLLNKYLFLKKHLSKEDAKLLRIDGLPIGRLYEMMKQYKSIGKLFAYLRLYRQKKVPVFTPRLLNPVVVLKAIRKRL